MDVEDGITSTSGISLREQAFPLNEVAPRWWPWRPGNTFTPTTGMAVPGTRLVISFSPSEEAHEVHDSSGVPTLEGDSYFCMPRNISVELA
ncbi:Hypothetical protein FKW44_023159 [Caligus rogercresseyi]|uniref:Uncharacterized protein n=1 Tax=Caligus rogercresseyi TaxID=217165 RepID=A0A7T8GPD1_CALRO|nr:Hypothetical protein FKW44_023159 [Caligus rogercresseyi]